LNHLDTKNLVPFSKRRDGFRLSGMKQEDDQEMLQQVDPNLQPEDEGMIRRYLRYADTLLGASDKPALTLVPGAAVNTAVAKFEYPVRFELSVPSFETEDKVA
jgi:hypothetical protein